MVVVITQWDDALARIRHELQFDADDIGIFLSAPPQVSKKSDCPLIKLAIFGDIATRAGCLRHDGNIIAVCGVEGDYDGGILSMHDAAARLQHAGIRAWFYTSPSHTEERPRWRVIALLSAPVHGNAHTLRATRARYLRRIDQALGGILSPESYTLSQSYYIGHVAGHPYDWAATEGQYVDLIEGLDDAAPDPQPSDWSDDESARIPLTERQIAEIISALEWIGADDRQTWLTVGMILHSDIGGQRGFKIWSGWAQASPKFNVADQRRVWQSFRRTTGDRLTRATLFQMAYDAGWPGYEDTTPPAEDALIHPPIVGLIDLDDAEPQPPEYLIESILPANATTLIGGHGGTGKSQLALRLAICTALGLPFFGLSAARVPTIFYSAEDPADVVRWRAKALCSSMGISPSALAGWLTVFDLTDHDPVLFQGGPRASGTTPRYQWLVDQIAGLQARVVVIDNASDVFAADEINRAQVRAFVRACTSAVKPVAGAVALLGHVDKGAARESNTSEGYSGSTAWNNSVRSRLYLRTEGAGLVLEHQKSNWGRKADPIRLSWSGNIIVSHDDAGAQSADSMVQYIKMRAVLRVIADFNARDENIHTNTTGPGNTFSLLAGEPSFPRIDARDLSTILRDAERQQLVVREEYKNHHRERRQRWALTAKGRAECRSYVPGEDPATPANGAGMEGS